MATAPDGTLYAAFGRAGADGTALHASRDGGSSWTSLDGPGRPEGDALAFRELAVDPRSDASRHALLSAPSNEREGLWQVSIDWSGAAPSATWERVFWYDTRDSAPFATGWEGGIYGTRRAKSQANAVVVQDGRTFLLAHFAGPLDFGAANTESELWGAAIDPSNPGPVRWTFLAGGTGTYGDPRGLANDVYTAIVPDPSAPGRVYVASREQGVYAIPDVGYLYDARVGGLELDFYPRLQGSPGANEYENALVLDPNDPTTLWVASGNALLRGTRDDPGGGRLVDRPWTWTPVLGSDRLMTFDAWERDGRTVVAAAATVDGVSGLYHSEDQGESWQRVSTVDELTALRDPTRRSTSPTRTRRSSPSRAAGTASGPRCRRSRRATSATASTRSRCPERARTARVT